MLGLFNEALRFLQRAFNLYVRRRRVTLGVDLVWSGGLFLQLHSLGYAHKSIIFVVVLSVFSFVLHVGINYNLNG